MKKNVENTLGQKIANCRTIANHVAHLAGYVARTPDLEGLVLLGDVDVMAQLNAEEARELQLLANATDARTVVFRAVDVMVSDVSTATKGQYGRASREWAAVLVIARDMRGTNLSRRKVRVNAASSSQSHTAHGTLAMRLADLAAMVGTFVPAYSPLNAKATVAAAQALQVRAMEANDAVQAAYYAYLVALNARNEAYHLLRERMKRVKDALADIFGRNSREYRAVSGLVI